MRLKSSPVPQVAVFCSGSGSNLEALLAAERKGLLGARIALVVCDKPGAFAIVRANRAKKPVFLLEAAGFTSREAYDAAVTAVLRKLKIDLVVLAGFMRILSADFVRVWRGHILNIHPSILPAFKGAHAIRDAFAYGVKVTGVTVHFVTEDLDTGPVVAQEAVPVAPRDTLKSLEEKIHKVEHRLYARAVRLVAGGNVKYKENK